MHIHTHPCTSTPTHPHKPHSSTHSLYSPSEAFKWYPPSPAQVESGTSNNCIVLSKRPWMTWKWPQQATNSYYRVPCFTCLPATHICNTAPTSLLSCTHYYSSPGPVLTLTPRVCTHSLTVTLTPHFTPHFKSRCLVIVDCTEVAMVPCTNIWSMWRWVYNLEGRGSLVIKSHCNVPNHKSSIWA